MATGIPATGSIANMLAATFIAVIGLKIVNNFGAAIVMITAEGALSVPTLINGPPGLHKILMLFIVGVLGEVILLSTKRSNKGYLLFGIILPSLVVLLIYASLVVLGLPGEENLRGILIPLLVISGITGLIGAYLGLKVYDEKLQHLSVVQNLKSQ